MHARRVAAALAVGVIVSCLGIAGCGSGEGGQIASGATITRTDAALPAPTRPPTTVTAPATTVTVTAPGTTVTAPAETVTAPAETVTAPAETVTAPSRTVTAPAATVTVTTDSSHAGAAAAGVAAGAAVANAGDESAGATGSPPAAAQPAAASEPDDVPNWLWGLIGALAGGGIAVVAYEIVKRRRRGAA